MEVLIVRQRGRFGGAAFIAGLAPGLVTVNSVPAAREVELRDRATRQVVEVTFSTPSGHYRFECIDPARLYDAHGRDWTGVYNDTITSRIRPALY